MTIGGAEDKLKRREVLAEFVRRAGGAEARIAVIPTASSLGPEIVDVYEAVFARLGAASTTGLRPQDRGDAHDDRFVAPLREATGIFMTGGNQLKLSGVVAGTPFGDAIKQAHLDGTVVGGTSAGASIQSSHMVAFGAGGATPKQRMTQVAAGLGLVEQAVVDQHFEQRNRYGRLLMIVAQNPQLLGIGVDEDTAAVFTRAGADDPAGHPEGHDVLSVVGRGAVTVMDPTHLVSNAHEAPRSRPMLASGLLLHVLPAGAAYDLTERRLLPAAVAPATDDLAEANEDLRRLARDIAAGDASPSALRRRVARRRTKD